MEHVRTGFGACDGDRTGERRADEHGECGKQR
jgi:hypothetical protein